MVTLARALKYKNRVIERMRKVEDDLRSNNSVLQGGEREYDPDKLLQERLMLENHLLDLKMQIDTANKPIKEAILRMQELKARVTFLASIPTAHGKQQSHRSIYGEHGEVVYDAIIRKQQIDEIVMKAKKELDSLQEALDRHNNTVEIDVVMMTL